MKKNKLLNSINLRLHVCKFHPCVKNSNRSVGFLQRVASTQEVPRGMVCLVQELSICVVLVQDLCDRKFPFRKKKTFRYVTTNENMLSLLKHTVDTEFSVTNFFCLHFSEHAQWGLPVMSDILVKIFVDISCNICEFFLL